MKNSNQIKSPETETTAGNESPVTTAGSRFSGMNMFALYPGLKDQQYGEGTFFKLTKPGVGLMS